MASTQQKRKEKEEWHSIKREDIVHVLLTSTYRLRSMIIWFASSEGLEHLSNASLLVFILAYD